MNIKEAAGKAGVSVRTLRYYEETGLITPVRGENGYREYDPATIGRIRLIHVYRELGFSLEEAGRLVDMPRMERDAALEGQIRRMQQRRQIIDNRIALAQSLRMLGPEMMTEIDFSQVDAQLEQSRKYLAENEDMQKLSARLNSYTEETGERLAQELTEYLARVANAAEHELPSAVESLKRFIESHFGVCTDVLLAAYARAYGGDGILAQVLEDAAGPGAGERLLRRLTQQ